MEGSPVAHRAGIARRFLRSKHVAFRGVPAELLFDQMKAVIIDDHHEIDGRLLENQEFVRFAAHWASHPCLTSLLALPIAWPSLEWMQRHIAEANNVYASGSMIEVLRFSSNEIRSLLPCASMFFREQSPCFYSAAYIWRTGSLKRPSAHRATLIGVADVSRPAAGRELDVTIRRARRLGSKPGQARCRPSLLDGECSGT